MDQGTWQDKEDIGDLWVVDRENELEGLRQKYS